MARQRRRQPSALQHRPEQRPQIGNEPIVPGDQLVQLTAGRGVLILEAVRLSGRVRTQRAVDDRLVDRSKLVAGSGKEARDRGEAVRDARWRATARSRSGAASPVSRL